VDFEHVHEARSTLDGSHRSHPCRHSVDPHHPSLSAGPPPRVRILRVLFSHPLQHLTRCGSSSVPLSGAFHSAAFPAVPPF